MTTTPAIDRPPHVHAVSTGLDAADVVPVLTPEEERAVDRRLRDLARAHGAVGGADYWIR